MRLSSRFFLLLVAVGLFFVAQGALASIASATPCLVTNGGPCSVSGTKFNDLDADGQNKEAGEPGLAGFTFFADYDSDGVLDVGEPSAISAADGSFTITGINCPTSLCGSSQSVDIREVGQTGWTCSYPATCKYVDVGFESNKNPSGKNFGNWRPASKSGTKFEDLNGNGAWDKGEPGLEGWTIYVDLDGNGALDQGEPSAVTDANGDYTITGIKPTGSQQLVREVQQEGWTCSYPDPCEYSELFQSGDVKSKNNFGNYLPGQVSGLKFNDVNGNGSKDTGEGALAGFTFYLDLNNNSQFDPGEPSAVSDANGAFAITGIAPGTYTLRETGGDAGYTCTFPAGCSYQVDVTSQGDASGKDFGNKPPPTENPPVGPSGGTNAETGSASVSAPSGCVSTTFKVKVSGKQITKVTIKIDGKTKKTFTGNGGSSQSFTYKVNTKKYKKGAHRLKTTTTFTAGSKTPTKTTSQSFQRCGRQSVNPKFTG